MTIVLLHFLSKINFNLNTSKIIYYFLILLAMLMTYSASSQVTADFSTIDSTSACGSLIVEFQDLSIGNPNSWLWDLGNGNTSTLQNPIMIYTNPGFYTVQLTSSNSLYNDFMRKMDFCIVTLQNQEIFKRSLKGEGKLQDQCKKSNCICLLYEYRPIASGGSAGS